MRLLFTILALAVVLVAQAAPLPPSLQVTNSQTYYGPPFPAWIVETNLVNNPPVTEIWLVGPLTASYTCWASLGPPQGPSGLQTVPTYVDLNAVVQMGSGVLSAGSVPFVGIDTVVAFPSPLFPPGFTFTVQALVLEPWETTPRLSNAVVVNT